MKAKTLLITHDLRNIANEGEFAVCIQGTKKKDDIITVNMDWSFDKSLTPEELKSFFGGFLGNLEDIFGEKMVTEAITHWADETGKLVKAPGGKLAYLKSRGLDFKKDKNNE